MSHLRQGVSRWVATNSAVALLLANACGALFCTGAVGLLVYSNTQRQISAAGWVQHTEEVLSALQRVSLLTERIQYRTRLYVLTGNAEQLARAQASANQLETATVRVRELVSDNSGQAESMLNLLACSKDLNGTVDRFTATSDIPEPLIQRCQKAIGLMTDSEQWLLKERNLESDRSSSRSISTGLIFLVVSLAMLLILFWFLIRDAIVRQRVGKQTSLTNRSLALSVKALEDRAEESQLLNAARDELQLCVDVQQVYRSATNSFARLLTGTSGSLCMINNSRQMVEAVSFWGNESAAGGTKSAVEDHYPFDSCCGLRSGQSRWRQPETSGIDCTHFNGPAPERYLCVPIVAHGNTLGVLYVQCPDNSIVELVHHHSDGLRQLVQLTGMAVATMNLRAKLENQSIRDSLTGLFNRDFMQISLEREISRAARRKQTMAVFMLDLDHFKRLNDTFGHAAGDTVLKAVSELFRSSIRNEDIACRYGGEEFTIMMPDVTPEVAMDRAEAIRRSVQGLRLPFDQEVNGEFTISIGVAIYPNDGETADLLLRRADMALYRVKRSGRNQVAAYATMALPA